ncbi:helix-turn-helix transcriptional regulator [Cellulomonas alba]|uniref:Helix-turn-helix domain-containing protein n=1 Tax=Cellulomonas alba TaxID=3053467 RepID=A0ABT7SKD9_9CELL|nr:helix-turn-helix domain-containing protein [Cellulomonas alba]MDM7856489.1 helix-turn-helix domain-containing protein [Cellulomonas alba]
MSATLPVAERAVTDVPDAASDASTRQRLLRLVATDGPIAAPDLAERLDLTPAGVRRHLGVLLSTEQIALHDGPAGGPARRGRPARHYVVTSRGQAALSQRYSELATEALRYLAATIGEEAVAGFAEERVHALEAHLADVLRQLDGADVAQRAQAMADGLTAEGYAATARPVPGNYAIQLCQGHCPVQEVAHQFPQLCEAETRAFGRLLGVHVQRLSTLASGGHVCTTSIPTITRSTAPTSSPEGPTR